MRLLLVLLTAANLMAVERKLPAGLEPVAQLALSAPPEFAADGLLRLVESKKITDQKTEIDLTQQAFDLAGSAHFRVAMHAVPGTAADTRADSLAKAYGLNLDSVALQSRAVMAMLQFDKNKAKQMFSAIPPMDLPPLSCEDSLAYAVAPFYRALTAVMQQGFTAKERAKEDHVAFLLQYVGQVHNQAQVGPLEETLKSAGLSPKQYEAVLAQFNTAVEATYRDKPTCKEGSAKTEAYWQTPDAKRLLTDAKALRFAPGGARMLSDDERTTPEWQRQLTDFLKEVAEWDASAEKSEADYYQQKCIVYEALMELIPPGAERDKALEEFIAFIGNSNLQSSDPVSWFLPAQSMLQRVRNSNNGEPAKVLAAFEKSGNPVLCLYALLERTFVRPVPSFAATGSF
jgi:truncated hemoglobin YjbI